MGVIAVDFNQYKQYDQQSNVNAVQQGTQITKNKNVIKFKVSINAKLILAFLI
jgi:hypothetical protein